MIETRGRKAKYNFKINPGQEVRIYARSLKQARNMQLSARYFANKMGWKIETRRDGRYLHIKRNY